MYFPPFLLFRHIATGNSRFLGISETSSPRVTDCKTLYKPLASIGTPLALKHFWLAITFLYTACVYYRTLKHVNSFTSGRVYCGFLAYGFSTGHGLCLPSSGITWNSGPPARKSFGPLSFLFLPFTLPPSLPHLLSSSPFLIFHAAHPPIWSNPTAWGPQLKPRNWFGSFLITLPRTQRVWFWSLVVDLIV